MNQNLEDLAKNLKKGTTRIFGFLQVDISKHSSISCAPILIPEIRDNLHRLVDGSVSAHRGVEQNWSGDGGSYLFLIDSGSEYDQMVICALRILDSIPLFNWLTSVNRLQVPLQVRISCHKGELIWDPELVNVHGRDLNYFLKSEREIGIEDKVVITEEVFESLINDQLKKIFKQEKEHEYSSNGKIYNRKIFSCSSLDSTIRGTFLPEVVPYPSAEELAIALSNTSLIEVMLAGGDSFYTTFSEALQRNPFLSVKKPTLKILLRRSSVAASRSANKYLHLKKSRSINVGVRWYDYDFMLRGYCFDRKFGYLSFFLREQDTLSGRINNFINMVKGRSKTDDFFLNLFCRTFDAFYNRSDATNYDDEKLAYIREL